MTELHDLTIKSKLQPTFYTRNFLTGIVEATEADPAIDRPSSGVVVRHIQDKALFFLELEVAARPSVYS